MRRSRACIVTALLGALTMLSGCTVDEPSPVASTTPHITEGSSVASLAAAGKVRIGVLTDVPGVGYLQTGASTPEGFDVEIAKILSGALGIPESGIEWVAVSPLDRESALTLDKVDLVIAAFSMTDERAEVVGQAGPYYLTGQQIMVADDSDIAGLDDLHGRTVCSVGGSDSDQPLVEHGAITKAYSSYSACVDALLSGELDAVSTDGAILGGFLDEHPDELMIVGQAFSAQRYGVGYRLGDTAMCQFITEALLVSYENGSWEQAYESTLGSAGIDAPRPPNPDPCPAG